MPVGPGVRLKERRVWYVDLAGPGIRYEAWEEGFVSDSNVASRDAPQYSRRPRPVIILSEVFDESNTAGKSNHHRSQLLPQEESGNEPERITVLLKEEGEPGPGDQAAKGRFAGQVPSLRLPLIMIGVRLSMSKHEDK